jgi:hypothetical protein
MADDNSEENAPDETESEGDGEEKSFRERVEEIREKRAEEGEGEEGDRREKMEEMMGGGPGGMGGGGGNPFAQMMGGMMGGGPGGMGGGPGGRPGESESRGDEELVREVRQLRDEVRDATRQLQRIADAVEDLDD